MAHLYFVGAKRYPVFTYFIDTLADMLAKKRDLWSISQNEAARKLKDLVLPTKKLKDKRLVVTSFAQHVGTEVITHRTTTFADNQTHIYTYT